MKYISLLRGINVSGQKKVTMPDLKLLYATLGFKNVTTYIQSGNVIFDTSIKSKIILKEKIEKSIAKKYKFHVPVEIRTSQELIKIIKQCPFDSVDIEKEGTKLLVTFLSSPPSKSRIIKILNYVNSPEKLVIKGTEAYLYCPNGYGKSKLSNNFLEKKLEVKATTRNWKSVQKLYELSASTKH